MLISLKVIWSYKREGMHFVNVFTPQFFFYYTLGKVEQHVKGLDMIFLIWLILEPWYNPISFILSDMQLLDMLQKLLCCRKKKTKQTERQKERESNMLHWGKKKWIVAVLKFLQLSQDRTNYWVKTPLGKQKTRWKLISRQLITSFKWWDTCCCICIDSGNTFFYCHFPFHHVLNLYLGWIFF